MNNEKTDLIVIVDESGSMASVKSDTIGGINNFIETHQKLPGKANLTLVKFNTKSSILYNDIDIQDVKFLNESSYSPSGGTALLDAVGKTIDLVLKKINNSKEDAPKTILCILTDGEENSSIEYTKEQIKSIIENVRINNDWNCIFIGANQDAWDAGSSLGSNQNVNFIQTDIRKTLKSMSHYTANTRGAGSSYATLYNVAGVGSAITYNAFTQYADSFTMSEDELDKELAKFANVSKITKTKKTKV